MAINANMETIIMSEFENPTAVGKENEYDASEIQVLEGLEAVRKRPGMYIGSTSSSGLHHLVYEIVDNSIDEALAGYCGEITVEINEGDTITVTDNGRGIPVDIQAQTGRPALEVVFSVLHAGGKFGGGGYKVSGGLHGVGASVVNALSEWLVVQVHKDGKIFEMRFARGAITQEIKVVGESDRSGTVVTFKPDSQIFEETLYSYDTLHTRMREQAFLNAGLKIRTVDHRSGQEQEDNMVTRNGTVKRIPADSLKNIRSNGIRALNLDEGDELISVRETDGTANMPKQFAGFRDVSVFRTGVLGTTGIESAEAVQGLIAQTKPAVVIAVDALAARRLNRVCATVQLSDTGIIPGSGVGNHRLALNRETLGLPVLAVGVPTVVDGATLAADLLEESGITEFDEKKLRGRNTGLFVTPRDIDAQVRDLSKAVGYWINWALQDLEIGEINALLS